MERSHGNQAPTFILKVSLAVSETCRAHTGGRAVTKIKPLWLLGGDCSKEHE